MDVTCAQAQNQIARSDHIPNIAMETLQPRLIAHAAMTVRNYFIDDCLSTDAGKRRFARGINVGHHDAIGAIERAPKLASECFCARIAMGLKHRENAVASGRFRGRQGR